MYIKEYLKQFGNKKIKLFVDMDGVISDYVVGYPYGFDKKRPLMSNIAKLKDISKMSNVEMYILSITRLDKGYEEKNIWLDKYAPFFKKENRIIISKEHDKHTQSKEHKANFLRSFKRDGCIIVVIDDDPDILKEIEKTSKDIFLLKDTALVD